MKEIKLSGPALSKLFADIGGEPALTRILHAFYKKMETDVLIGFFFDGHDVLAIAEKQKQFLMRAWGVARSYSGKAPAESACATSPILVGHFDRRLVLLAETLREAGVGEEQIRTWVTFEEKFRQAVQHG